MSLQVGDGMRQHLDDRTVRQLRVLARAGFTTLVDTLQEAVDLAWRELQYRRLEDAYAEMGAEPPPGPPRSGGDAAVRRARRAEQDRRRSGP